MDGSATLEIDVLMLATTAPRISVVRMSPARAGAVPPPRPATVGGPVEPSDVTAGLSHPHHPVRGDARRGHGGAATLPPCHRHPPPVQGLIPPARPGPAGPPPWRGCRPASPRTTSPPTTGAGPRGSATWPARPAWRCRVNSSTPTPTTRACTATSCRGRSGARPTPTTSTSAAPSTPTPPTCCGVGSTACTRRCSRWSRATCTSTRTRCTPRWPSPTWPWTATGRSS